MLWSEKPLKVFKSRRGNGFRERPEMPETTQAIQFVVCLDLADISTSLSLKLFVVLRQTWAWKDRTLKLLQQEGTSRCPAAL